MTGRDSAASMLANIGRTGVWASMPGAAQSFNLDAV